MYGSLLTHLPGGLALLWRATPFRLCAFLDNGGCLDGHAQPTRDTINPPLTRYFQVTGTRSANRPSYELGHFLTTAPWRLFTSVAGMFYFERAAWLHYPHFSPTCHVVYLLLNAHVFKKSLYTHHFTKYFLFLLKKSTLLFFYCLIRL